jgi:putative peptide zinc metalloprotease protein
MIGSNLEASPEIGELPEASGEARPVLADGVELIGAVDGSGFRDKLWLVRRGDSFVQVTELLYRVAERCDGTRTVDRIAQSLTDASSWLVTPENVRHLLQQKLMPLGLVSSSAGPTERARTTGPPGRSALSVQFRRTLIGGRGLERLSRPLRILFTWPVLWPVVLATLGAHGWMYFGHGASASVAEVLQNPALFLAVVGLLIAAALVHELGHAAALSYAGGRSRGMGVGFYLLFPAFFTDVTESYRLARRDRVRTDLGGVYFHLVCALVLVGIYALTQAEFLLLVVVLIDVEVLRQLMPFLRLDGYWLLSDLTGIPDFFSQIGPFVRSLRRGAQSAPRLPALQPGARVTFAAFLLLSAIILPTLLFFSLSRLPGYASLAWQALIVQKEELADALELGEVIEALAAAVQILLLGVQILGVGLFVYLVIVRPLFRGWRWIGGLPSAAVRRLLNSSLLVALGGAVLVLGSLYPWRVFGPIINRVEVGTSQLPGKAVLVIGGGLLLAAGLHVAARRAAVRRLAAIIAVCFALSGSAVGLNAFVDMKRWMDRAIQQSVQNTTGRPATAGEVGEIREAAAALGISASAGYGVYVAMFGGALALLGGGLALTVRSAGLDHAPSTRGHSPRTAPSARGSEPPA